MKKFSFVKKQTNPVLQKKLYTKKKLEIFDFKNLNNFKHSHALSMGFLSFDLLIIGNAW